MPRLSVILPIHNEAATVGEIVRRVRASGWAHEIVAVDDGSTDTTPAMLAGLQFTGAPPLTLCRHVQRRGKGAAIRTGLSAVTGDLVLVQDADLEYDPADYPALLAPFADPAVGAVYGSRNLRSNPRSTKAFYWGGRLISTAANLLYGTRLTDIATGYKVFRAPLLRAAGLAGDGFEFCPEVTARLLRRGVIIREVPVSYRPRTWSEGKKIRARDGVIALWTLLRLRVG
ncbi:MAG: glycosyltransferase family 2 protein [Verrucomicrobia bacterium]|nr:glycosyltransferase family 2 protein [Verrucomicrobiota bacterium]